MDEHDLGHLVKVFGVSLKFSRKGIHLTYSPTTETFDVWDCSEEDDEYIQCFKTFLEAFDLFDSLVKEKGRVRV
jgi:hypothetical protein